MAIRSSLGRRIVFLMILVSAALSILSSAVQLYFSYQRDLDRVMSELTNVDTSFRTGLETALWQFNFRQVDVLLDGIYAQADVEGLKLEAVTGQTFERGTYGTESQVTNTFDLSFTPTDRQPESVGTLIVSVSLGAIRARLWEDLITLLLSNFIKTLLASFAMLTIFDLLLSRHLRSVTDQIGSQNWLLDPKPIELNRSRANSEDELDLIVSTLNEAGERINKGAEARAKAERLMEHQKQSAKISAIRDELEVVLNMV